MLFKELSPSSDEIKAKPWGFWTTLWLSTIIFALFSVLQFLVVIVFLSLAKGQRQELDLQAYAEGLSSNGFILAITVIVLGSICLNSMHVMPVGRLGVFFRLNLPPNTNLYFLERNILARGCNRILRGFDQSETARDFHVRDRDTLNRVRLKDLSQLFFVILNVVEFWTTDDHHFSFDEILMEISIGKRNTVGCYQKVGVLEIGSMYWN